MGGRLEMCAVFGTMPRRWVTLGAAECGLPYAIRETPPY
jgi:hypothetical protein